MGLYERIAGSEEPKIAVHTFMAVMQEYMLGNMTAQQAIDAFGLDGTAASEAAALRTRILAETNANATTQGILRRLKALEIEQILILLETETTPFHAITAVKTRLGVS